MAKSKLAGVFAVLFALTLFFGGMLTYRLLAGTSMAQQPALRSESVGIQGKVAIQVYSSSGRLVTSWTGHNSLTNWPINALAGCIPGLTTAPAQLGSCSGPWITRIAICSETAGCPSAVATNTMVPSGCNPTNSGLCTGWQSTATIQIPAAATYTSAFGSTDIVGFDRVVISPGLSLNAGDRAVVTITFTVS